MIFVKENTNEKIDDNEKLGWSVAPQQTEIVHLLSDRRLDDKGAIRCPEKSVYWSAIRNLDHPYTLYIDDLYEMPSEQ
jgi:hypothetical protein